MVHRPVGDERLLDEIPDTVVVLRKTGGFRADGPPVGDLARIPLPVKRTVVGLPTEPVAGFTEHRGGWRPVDRSSIRAGPGNRRVPG